MLKNRALAAAALGLAALALPIRAAQASVAPARSVPRLAVSGPLRAGQTVDIDWAPLGTGTEELELLLSLDGGRTWHVRVSPELPGESIRYRWRVPNLAAADARVRLRARVDEREIELPASDRFVIESDPSLPLDRRLVSEGSWWDGFEGMGSVTAELAGGAAPSLVASHVVTSSEETPRLVLPACAAAGRRLAPRATETAAGVAPSAPPALPRSQPLRN